MVITIFNAKITYVVIWYVNSLDYWNKKIKEQNKELEKIREFNKELDEGLKTLGMEWFAKWMNMTK